MEILEHLDVIVGALSGGIVTQLANWGITRKKGKSEAKAMEIENIKTIVDQVYQPLIEQQNRRIKELETEVKALRDERDNMRVEHQKEIAKLQKQILDITRALGLKATNHVRNSKGQFAKQEEEEA